MRSRRQPRAGAVLREALAVLRARRMAVIGLAVVIIVPVGAMDRVFLSWSRDLNAHHQGVLALMVSLVSTSIFMLGSVVYAGILEHIVAEQRGHGVQSMLTVLRRVPYGRLLVADLVVSALTILGLVLCILPGIVAMTLMALVGALMGIEQLGVRRAIRRSAALVRRRFGLVFLLVSLPLIVQVMVGGSLDALSAAGIAFWVLGSVLIPLAMVVYVGLVTVTLAIGLTDLTDHVPLRDEPAGATG